MTTEPVKKPAKRKLSTHLRPADLAGLAKLVTSATLGVTGIAEGAHQAVWSTLGVPGGDKPGETRGITGTVFKTIKGITQLVGLGLDAGLSMINPPTDPDAENTPTTPEREAILAALNGVLGDHMAASNNPLTTLMKFRFERQVIDVTHPITVSKPGSKILVLIHGSCMNDLQWHTKKNGQVVNHGLDLARELGYTPLYVRYNTGRHISENGHEFAEQLEQLLANWPQPIEEFSILAHSMGGLVTRSACHYAEQAGHAWLAQLKKVVFLGTPHWGSPLERAGNWVDVILASTPYTAPYAAIGQIRSAGVTDLRHGYLLDEDWQGHERFHRKPDSRAPLPLPEGIRFHTIAATLAAKRGPLADRLVGDGLVPLHSALGKHEDEQRSLVFAEDAQVIFYRMNHIDLLASPRVSAQLIAWFGDKPDTERPVAAVS